MLKSRIFRLITTVIVSVIVVVAHAEDYYVQTKMDGTDSEGTTSEGVTTFDGVYFVQVKTHGADGTEYDIKRDVNLLRGYTNSETTNQ